MVALTKWDHRFMALARQIAQWSKDPSTKVGSVIVGPYREIRSAGYNGFPPKVDDTRPERYNRPQKYYWSSHSEENAIAFSAHIGALPENSTIYVTMFPCATCTRLIIRAGISRVVAPAPDRPDWAESHAVSIAMLDEAGVNVTYYEDEG